MNDRLPVAISAADHSRLEGVVQQASADGHPVADFLRRELRRALVISDEMPNDVVTLNGWVTYRRDWGWTPETHLLVCPENYRDPFTHLSVLSPLGAALIGLRVGSRVSYRSIEGVAHVASVESLDAPIILGRGKAEALRRPNERHRRK